VVSTWMGDCLWTGKPSWYITNTNITSAFHPSAVGKSSLAGVKVGPTHRCRVAGNTVWSHMAGDAP